MPKPMPAERPAKLKKKCCKKYKKKGKYCKKCPLYWGSERLRVATSPPG